MQDFLELILKNITTHPDAVVIAESQEDGYDVYTITVDPEDMGRVIGKDGKVIKAIRSLAHVVAIRQNKHVRIKLADSEVPAPAAPVDQTVVKAKNPEPKEDTDLIAGAIDLPQNPEEK